MNKLTSLSLLLSFSLALVSCAHQGRAPEVVLTEEQVERLNREALELAAERLDALAEESQRQGPASSQYLATGLFLKGNSALMSGDFATALVLLKPLTKLTADPFVHKKYAVALIRTGQMEAAQKVLDKLGPAMVSKHTEVLAQAKAGWLEASKADTEFGGDKIAENLAVARKALDKFGTPALRTMLDESGLGNHPEIIRAFYRAGKAISEDSFVPATGGGSPKGGKDYASSLYPNQQT